MAKRIKAIVCKRCQRRKAVKSKAIAITTQSEYKTKEKRKINFICYKTVLSTHFNKITDKIGITTL